MTVAARQEDPQRSLKIFESAFLALIRQVLQATVDAERLAHNVSASIRAEEKNHGRYIISRDENLKRGDGRQLVSHCIFGDFIRRRLGFDYPVYPGAFDCARLNAVTADSVRPEFECQSARKAYNPPLCRRIGATQWKAEFAGCRGEIDNRTAARVPQIGYRHLAHQEGTGQVDI